MACFGDLQAGADLVWANDLDTRNHPTIESNIQRALGACHRSDHKFSLLHRSVTELSPKCLVERRASRGPHSAAEGTLGHEHLGPPVDDENCITSAFPRAGMRFSADPEVSGDSLPTDSSERITFSDKQDHLLNTWSAGNRLSGGACEEFGTLFRYWWLEHSHLTFRKCMIAAFGMWYLACKKGSKGRNHRKELAVPVQLTTVYAVVNFARLCCSICSLTWDQQKVPETWALWHAKSCMQFK
jgi:hypothetical protein